MIKTVLGAASALVSSESACGCFCDCYPHPRGGSYSNGYASGTADGAWVPGEAG